MFSIQDEFSALSHQTIWNSYNLLLPFWVDEADAGPSSTTAHLSWSLHVLLLLVLPVPIDSRSKGPDIPASWNDACPQAAASREHDPQGSFILPERQGYVQARPADKHLYH